MLTVMRVNFAGVAEPYARFNSREQAVRAIQQLEHDGVEAWIDDGIPAGMDVPQWELAPIYRSKRYMK